MAVDLTAAEAAHTHARTTSPPKRKLSDSHTAAGPGSGKAKANAKQNTGKKQRVASGKGIDAFFGVGS